jgi:hypothetical protein
MIYQPATIHLAEGKAGAYSIAIAPQQPCHAIVVGQVGAGKSTALNLWAWRFIQAGTQVLIVGADRNIHAGIAPIARRNHITCEVTSIATPSTGMTADLTIVETHRRSTTPATDRLRRAHRVGVLLEQIAERRMDQQSHAHVRPLIVMLDEDLDFERGVSHLAAAHALWPALNMHLWIAVQSAARLLKSPAPAVRSLWLASALQLFLHADMRGEAQAAGLTDAEAEAISHAAPGQITIRSSGAGLRGWRQTDQGMLRACCPAEAAIVAARQNAHTMAA